MPDPVPMACLNLPPLPNGCAAGAEYDLVGMCDGETTTPILTWVIRDTGSMARPKPPGGAVPAKPPCGGAGGTNKYDAIAHAMKQGWKVEEVFKLIEALK